MKRKITVVCVVKEMCEIKFKKMKPLKNKKKIINIKNNDYNENKYDCYNGDDEDENYIETCSIGRSLISFLFGFIISFIIILLFEEISFISLFIISLSSVFGYLGSEYNNPLNINIYNFIILTFICYFIYFCLFFIFFDVFGSLFSSFIVGILLPYLEIILKYNNLLFENSFKFSHNLTSFNDSLKEDVKV